LDKTNEVTAAQVLAKAAFPAPKNLEVKIPIFGVLLLTRGYQLCLRTINTLEGMGGYKAVTASFKAECALLFPFNASFNPISTEPAASQ
jgi:hypothetical protein